MGIVAFAILLFSATACGKEDASQQSQDNDTSKSDAVSESGYAGGFITVEADEDGKLNVPTEGITETATYVNYETDGNIVQLILVKGTDGVIRTVFNTCQVCNPSPNAYFVQNGDTFTCQNCGNKFSTDQLGVLKGGCNPAVVEELEETDDNIIIASAYLEQYSGNFASWQGPTE